MNHYSIMRGANGRRTRCGLTVSHDEADGRKNITCPACRAELAAKAARSVEASKTVGSAQEREFFAGVARHFDALA